MRSVLTIRRSNGSSTHRVRLRSLIKFIITLLFTMLGIFLWHIVRLDVGSLNASSSSSSSAAYLSAEVLPNRLLNPTELKLPIPILVMGLMKAGTTSIYGYFRCGLNPITSKLSHYDCDPPPVSRNMKTIVDNNRIRMSCGKRIRRNLTKLRQSAFYTIDTFTFYGELDAQENNGGMTLPQWDYVEEIYNAFPNATWILNIRNVHEWISSVNRWKDLRQRFVSNPFLPDLPRGVGNNDSDLIQFYLHQAERIRTFCLTHPTLSCVEVPIDQRNAGTILQNAFGISKACWKNRNINNGTAIWSAG